MRFSVDWQDGAVNRAPEERATVADFRIHVNDQNACMHLVGKETGDHLTMPVYGLAEGLAHSWWTLFGARDYDLSLTRFRYGFAVPDIRLSFNGQDFQCEARQKTYLNPDVRFWHVPAEAVSRSEAETELAGFIDKALARLRAEGLTRTNASARWDRVLQSRADPDEAAFCEAAGALRKDPYQIDEAGANLIDEAAALFRGECLEEFLAGGADVDTGRLLAWVRDVETRAPSVSALADLRPIAETVSAAAPVRTAEPGWSLGYRRAQGVRGMLNMTEKDRFAEPSKLTQCFGASDEFTAAPGASGIRILRTRHGEVMHLHLRAFPPGRESSLMFALGRGIGDAVCFPDDERSPVNQLRNAHRQAAGRAFAGEFLAPVAEVLAMRRDGYDHDAIADEFHVSTMVIEHQLENAPRIVDACRPVSSVAT